MVGTFSLPDLFVSIRLCGPLDVNIQSVMVRPYKAYMFDLDRPTQTDRAHGPFVQCWG